MPKLEFISDQNLTSCIEFLLEKAHEALKKAEVESTFNKNVIDPFATLFEIAGFNISDELWISNEKRRQAQKSLQNHIGDFHQKILGSVPGWKNLNTGKILDLVCEEKKIIAEIKNKHNTVSGGKLKTLHSDLYEQVMPKTSYFKGYTAYYVQIIPQKPERFNCTFTPPNNNTGSKKEEFDCIRQIDGSSFYALVTGIDDALAKLYAVIPEVISESTNPNCRKDLNRAFLNDYFIKAFYKKNNTNDHVSINSISD